MKLIQPIISIDGYRVFFDIAREGCGNGCRYCYVETAQSPQILWSEEELAKALDGLMGLQQFQENATKYMVSLCPSTEPLKNEKARLLVKQILGTLAPYGCLFQIATKERIPLDFLQDMQALLLFEGQLQINISINCFSASDILEPNAYDARARLENIELIRPFQNIKSCMLIKPFIEATYKDKDLFAKYLQEYLPDYICVGISFFKHHCVNEQDTTQFFKEHFAQQDTDRIQKFVKELEQRLSVSIYPSTLCVMNQIYPGIIKPNASKTCLCNKCGMCGYDEK